MTDRELAFKCNLDGNYFTIMKYSNINKYNYFTNRDKNKYNSVIKASERIEIMYLAAEKLYYMFDSEYKLSKWMQKHNITNGFNHQSGNSLGLSIFRVKDDGYFSTKYPFIMKLEKIYKAMESENML
jgi:hypothetical protein